MSERLLRRLESAGGPPTCPDSLWSVHKSLFESEGFDVILVYHRCLKLRRHIEKEDKAIESEKFECMAAKVLLWQTDGIDNERSEKPTR